MNSFCIVLSIIIIILLGTFIFTLIFSGNHQKKFLFFKRVSISQELSDNLDEDSVRWCHYFKVREDLVEEWIRRNTLSTKQFTVTPYPYRPSGKDLFGGINFNIITNISQLNYKYLRIDDLVLLRKL